MAPVYPWAQLSPHPMLGPRAAATSLHFLLRSWGTGWHQPPSCGLPGVQTRPGLGKGLSSSATLAQESMGETFREEAWSCPFWFCQTREFRTSMELGRKIPFNKLAFPSI